MIASILLAAAGYSFLYLLLGGGLGGAIFMDWLRVRVKGQDNATCNGLTNGQAAYAMFELLETYGTLDFDALRRNSFP
jgi:hypothetical protein